MAHEIESRINVVTGQREASAFFVREPAWHKLGTVLRDAPKTARDAMVAAKMDWMVEKEPAYRHIVDKTKRAEKFVREGKSLYVRREDTGLFELYEEEVFRRVEDPDRFAERHVVVNASNLIVRAGDEQPLGVVGPEYEPLQNLQAFSWFDPMIEEGVATYESAGSLFGGKKIWVLARMTEAFEPLPGDVVYPYVMLTSGHDGASGVHGRFTPIRVVCANTLGMATRVEHNEREKTWSVKHTSGMHAQMREARRYMGLVREQLLDTTQAYKLIAKVQLNAAKLDELLKVVVPATVLDPVTKELKVSTYATKARQQIAELMETAPGVEIPGVLGSGWGFYQAVAEFTDHVKGAGNTNPGSLDRRVNSMWFGASADMKQRALDATLALV